MALVPKVAPIAINVVGEALHVSSSVTLVDHSDDWLTFIVFVKPLVLAEHGSVVFSIRTQ